MAHNQNAMVDAQQEVYDIPDGARVLVELPADVVGRDRARVERHEGLHHDVQGTIVCQYKILDRIAKLEAQVGREGA